MEEEGSTWQLRARLVAERWRRRSEIWRPARASRSCAPACRSTGVPTDAGRLDRSTPGSPTARSDRIVPLLSAAHARAPRIIAGSAGHDAADALAARVYASDVIVALAAEGELEPADTRVAAAALAQVRDEPFAAAAFDLYLRAVSSPSLLELPPVVAAEIQLRLLLHLDVATRGLRLAPRRRRPGRVRPLARGRRDLTTGSAPRPRLRSPAAAGSRSSAARACAPRRSGASASRPARS